MDGHLGGAEHSLSIERNAAFRPFRAGLALPLPLIRSIGIAGTLIQAVSVLASLS